MCAKYQRNQRTVLEEMLKTALKKVIELSVLGLYRVGSENDEPYKKA